MRMIEADAFIEYLGLDVENAREENLGAVVSLEDFDRQQTAYDVDKVVGQMEEYVRESSNVDYNRAMIEAIEIVKSGGIEEEKGERE